MARDPVDVELAALREENERLKRQVTGLQEDLGREHLRFANAERELAALTDRASQEQSRSQRAIEALEEARAALTAQLAAAKARIATLEQLGADIRTILDRHCPAPKTDLEAAVADFVAKLPK